MNKIPVKVFNRLSQNIKKFRPIVTSAKSRDVNESDTVTIVTDILADLFGFDKYSEITREYAIRGTYCDLATKIRNKAYYLLEVKAIGIELKSSHIKQAVDYASNVGIDWVVLTNGNEWRVYKVKFAKPITHDLVFNFNFSNLNPKSKKDIELLFPLTKEGYAKSSLEAFNSQREALSKFSIGALIISDDILSHIRRELKKLSPDIKIELNEIKHVIQNEVLKREIIDSDELNIALKRIQKLKTKRKKRTILKDHNPNAPDNSDSQNSVAENNNI